MIYKYFNRIEAAEYLEISIAELIKLEEEYKIKYSGSRWHGDRYIFFGKDDLDDYLKSINKLIHAEHILD